MKIYDGANGAKNSNNVYFQSSASRSSIKIALLVIFTIHCVLRRFLSTREILFEIAVKTKTVERTISDVSLWIT